MTQQSAPEYISRKDENSNSKIYTYPNVHSSTIYNSQDTVTTEVPINRQTGLRRSGYHIYNRILLSHKTECNIAICGNMDGPRDYYT